MHSSTIYTARTDDLVVEDVGAEVLVYDKRSDVAHCLTPFAAAVWRRCEAGATLDDLSAIDGPGQSEDSEAAVLRALGELEASGLLEHTLGNEGVSRRHALRMAGIGIAAAAAPFVVSAAVPKAEAAGSPNTCGHVGAPCTGTLANAGNTCCATDGSGNALLCVSNVCTACIGSNVAPPGGNASLCCSGQTFSSGIHSGQCK